MIILRNDIKQNYKVNSRTWCILNLIDGNDFSVQIVFVLWQNKTSYVTAFCMYY